MASLTRSIKKTPVQDNLTPELITPVQRLMNVINNRSYHNVIHPYGMPEHPQEAADWWLTMQEPFDDSEAPRLTETTANNKTVGRPKKIWKTPYSDRVSECLVRYYKLNMDGQVYIHNLIKKGICWRGDSVEFMKNIETNVAS